MFLTRSEYGLWGFGDEVATARQAWMKALGPSDDEVEGMLFDTVEYQIESEQDAGLRTITGNLLDLAASHRQIKLVDHTHAVFGGCYGVAQEKLVRKAARELANANKIVLDATPKRPRDWTIGPAQQ